MEANTSTTVAGAGEMKRVLRMPQLIFFGVAFLSPGAVLLYFGPLNALSQGHFPMVVALTMIAMLFTASSYAKMSRRYPVAGSVYSYTAKTMHPNLGFVAGWAIMADYLLMPMICYLYNAIYLQVLMPGVPLWVFIVLTIIVATGLNLLGIKFAANVDLGLALIGVIFLAGTIVTAIIFIFGQPDLALANPKVLLNTANFTGSGVFASAAIFCVAFLGFDAVSTLAEETINPQKNIGRAAIGVCIVVGAMFIITSYIMNAAWPNGWNEFENSDNALTEFYVRIGAPVFNYLFILYNTVACIAIAVAAQVAVSRVMYGMGRDGFLPKKFFAYLSPKAKVPALNMILVGVIGLTAIIFKNNLTGALSLISFGALSGFFFVNLSVIFQYWKKDKLRSASAVVKYLVVPIIGMIIILYLLISLQRLAQIVGVIWLALGVIYLLIKTRGFKQLPPEIQDI